LNYAPFTFVGTDNQVNEEISVQISEGTFQSRIGGYIDRLDSKDGTLRIVDYKTG
jgi:RecB family exonuclease